MLTLISRPVLFLVAILGLGACMAPPPPMRAPQPFATHGVPITPAQFAAVSTRMRPVATQVCQERNPRLDCNFIVVLDDRPGQAPNAFHTRDRQGRPIIAFTLALLRDMRSEDELALVFGHEAAHHIADHIPRIQQQAMTGALIGGLVAAATGADQAMAQQLVNASATVGARRYSQSFELEADRLGTLITLRAGYDALNGAQIFRRIPDPGNQFLGTHPPNPARLAEIERSVTAYRGGQVF
jgi:predicted Zn-dependent protease